MKSHQKLKILKEIVVEKFKSECKKIKKLTSENKKTKKKSSKKITKAKSDTFLIINESITSTNMNDYKTKFTTRELTIQLVLRDNFRGFCFEFSKLTSTIMCVYYQTQLIMYITPETTIDQIEKQILKKIK